MLVSFSSTRALKLRLHYIEDIVAGGAILPTFPNLQILDVEGRYKDMNIYTRVGMPRLLGSCPVMSELRLRLQTEADWYHESENEDPVGGSFEQPMERFNRLSPMS
jgi:hypothetical protein